MDNQEVFQYTYSAREHAEIDSIRKRYLPVQESKLDRLRALDRSATQKAQRWALTLGILGVLILGTGMSLFMSDLGAILHMTQETALLVGILLGMAGLGLVIPAYPVYERILAKERQRIAPEILKLSDELMK